MKKFIIIISLVALSMTGCNKNETKKELSQNNIKVEETNKNTDEINKDEDKISEKEKIENIIKTYENTTPKQWGESLENVVTHMNTDKKEIALTLDACGGKNGSKYDEELIEFLDKEKIPATLFVNYRWIEANEDIFLQLAQNDNFQIENHGYEHKPLSANGKSIYNIEGTKNVKEIIKEIKLNEDKIYELTKKKTKYFRSGTAYYDEIAIKVAEELGYKIAGFRINSDGGATFSKEEVINAVNKAKSGDIIIGHFNQPKGYTYEGLKISLINLKNEGYEFVKLGD